MLLVLERAALAATRALSIVGLIALMGLAAMTLADGLMRSLANQPIEGVRGLGATMVLIAWQFYLFASELSRAHETTWVLQIPTAPFWYGVDAILWCAVVVQ